MTAISNDVLAEFRTYASATVYEAAGKLGDMGSEIRPINNNPVLVGRAYTVRCWPGDALAFMQAVEDAQPGDVLVIDSGAGHQGSTWGGTATIRAKARGLAGVVTNGTVRDVATIRALDFPVFSSGISPRGGVVNHSGWTGLQLAMAGITVCNGDLIVGDVDGVVVVAADRVAEVLARTRTQKAKEDDAEQKIRDGGSYRDVLAGYRAASQASDEMAETAGSSTADKLVIARSEDDVFRSDGPRAFFAYSEVGVKEATGGKAAVHRVKTLREVRRGEGTGPHFHTVEFQLMHVLAGRALVNYEGRGPVEMIAGTTIFQPKGIRHDVLEVSEDYDMIVVELPASFETKSVEAF